LQQLTIYDTQQVNIDWVGVVIERVTKKTLNEYFHQHIFEPLGLTQISMLPNSAMKKKLAYMHQRDSSGQISPRDHLLRRPLTVETQSDVESLFHTGGAGCFSTTQDYCRMPPSFNHHFVD
jgi:CubicO group peptidase (beta-lactamase class C family)